jgi:tetratricopeptide (TPR) repeat protein
MVAARGAPAEAIAHYRRALAAWPGFVEAHNNLGLALARSGDAAGAVQSFREALRHKPDDLDATHHLARALFAQGAAAEAVALLTRVLDRNGNAETRSLFAFCLRGLSGEELEPVRDYVLRALAEGWAHNGDLEQPGIMLVKRAHAMAACIVLANAAWLAGSMADLAQLLA